LTASRSSLVAPAGPRRTPLGLQGPQAPTAWPSFKTSRPARAVPRHRTWVASPVGPHRTPRPLRPRDQLVFTVWRGLHVL